MYKLFIVLLILVSVSVNANANQFKVPSAKLTSSKSSKSSKVLELRGGAFGVSKDTMKTVNAANGIFWGAQALFMPKFMWESFFNDPWVGEPSAFWMRIAGTAFLSFSYLTLKTCSDTVTPVQLAFNTVMTFIAPLNAQKVFDCKPLHMFPVIWMPIMTLLTLAAWM